jgi:hypothetical protein
MDDEPFSSEEQRALSLWRVPEPPPDLGQRALAQTGAQAARMPPLRGLAVAAAALVLLGGLVTIRTLRGQSPPPPLAEGLARPDAGPGPEVRQPFDGVAIEPS